MRRKLVGIAVVLLLVSMSSEAPRFLAPKIVFYAPKTDTRPRPKLNEGLPSYEEVEFNR